MSRAKTFGVAAVMMMTGVMMSAQAPVTKTGEQIKVTATIQQIDSTNRLITFKGADGKEDTVWAGPEVRRFNELKVGDKVTFNYYESTVYTIRKPGDPALPTGGSAAITPGSGKLPGGTIAAQATQTVTVKAVDPSAGSITVTTPAGRTVTRKVDKKEQLNGVKVGDKIDIVYTEAVVASVER